jgi:hypothetical protein
MVTIYVRGLAILILLAMDWFDIDWRVGLLAISIDALLTLFPFFADRSADGSRQ